MDWKAALAELRAQLPPEGGKGTQRGSLRWLETQMRERGANPAALRNIVYRNVGTPADKAALSAILSELAAEVGGTLALPAPPVSAALPDELELLGRSKKRVFKQFMAGVRAGRAPKLVVAGRRGAGKTVLLGQLEQSLGSLNVPIKRLNLSGDALEIWPAPAAQGRSFAALAARQYEAARRALPASGVLLLRVTADLNFGGDPPRLPDGTPTSAAVWAYEAFWRSAPPQVALLLALEDAAQWPSSAPSVTELRPPTPTEARAYLMQTLGVNREAADALVRETGRDLDRLTLLTGAAGHAAQLLGDPEVRRLAAALATLNLAPRSGGAEAYPSEVWQAALGRRVETLPLHVRSQLLRQEGGWLPTPALRGAAAELPAGAWREAAQKLVAEGPSGGLGGAVKPYWFAAVVALGQWPTLLGHLAHDPDDARFLPPLWPAIRASAPVGPREMLARFVVNHHAGRGEYHDPRARDALFSLLESEQESVQVWARVKLAESSVDAGNFAAAGEQLAHKDVQQIFAEAKPDPWTLSARSDALLVQAALARWQGDKEAATRAVSDPRTAQSGPRARLWRGLIAKDAGRWQDALENLEAVPPSSPLLSARARYQEGDLRLRLGQPTAALSALTDAAQRLEAAGGSAEELARILARAATAQRRLGRPAEGLALLERALALLPAESRQRHDGVPRARLLSEGLPILLALNQPEAALTQAAQALALLDLPGPRRAEAEYRTRRTHYRVALAYLTRGVGLPYLQPFAGAERDHPDLAYARTLLDHLLTRPTGSSDREQVLTFDMWLSRALVEVDPKTALAHIARALDMTDHPYAETQARAIRAEAYLRAGQPEAALSEINRAHALLRRVQVGLSGQHEADSGLAAQLLALEARATIEGGLTTLLWVRDMLQDPALHAFRAGVWRDTGHALERHARQIGGNADWASEILNQFLPEAAHLPMRPADKLMAMEAGKKVK